MARDKKTGGRNFKPGVSGNPKGRPVLFMDLRALASLPKHEVSEAAALMLAMPWNAAMDLLARSEVTVAQLLVASCLETATVMGCPRRFAYLIQIASRRP